MTNPILPLILSGGTGSRLWPISRESHPKPFLKLQDGESLLQKTFKRALSLQCKHIITLTNKAYFLKSKIEFEKNKLNNIKLSYFLEPCVRNTSAAIALATFKIIHEYGPDAILLVLPADHLIQHVEKFNLACQKAFAIAKDNKIVTFGVRPAYAETGYGYIECDEQAKVQAFIEKPEINLARIFSQSNHHFWNSGIFCFKASVILQEFAKFEPDLLKLAHHCYQISLTQNDDPEIFTFAEESFSRIKAISLDYAVMEKSQCIAMVPCDFDWKDIGCWEAYKKLHPSNKDGNTLMGHAVTIDSYNNFIQSEGRIIALIGIKNLTIVDTADALLISQREKVQEVKQITETLKAQAHQSYFTHCQNTKEKEFEQKTMKTAIVCDWLVTLGGAEKVLQAMLECFPEADLFAVVDFLQDKDRECILNKPVTTTFIQSLPFAKKKYRHYLPLMPLAIEQLDLSTYDLIISSSHAVAKGVISGPNQTHISYVHSPMRYAWDLQHQYLRESGLDKKWHGIIARYFLHKLRLWDLRSATGVDHFIANSHFIAKRILKTYRRPATIIYPPVNTDLFVAQDHKDDFYLTASRFVPYKRIDLIVESFQHMPNKRLVVIGDGPDFAKVKKKAGNNVTLLGFQSNHVLLDHLQRAKAFIFAAEEDFGLLPLEAQSCGTPVIAYGRGGALETVLDLNQLNPTGVFFKEQNIKGILQGVELFEKNQHKFTASNCQMHAKKFSPQIFKESFTRFVKECCLKV